MITLNAPEPVSETPLPHTTLNPAAAFETADEGYDGVPFPRPPREVHQAVLLADSDDGGTDPGQALRNDGLDPPRPPTLGGRLRESGIQAAEAIVAGGAAGAAAAVRSVSGEPDDAGPAGRRRLAGPHAAHPQAPAGTGAASRRGAGPPNHRKPSEVEPLPCWSGRARGRRRWSARRRRTSSASPRSKWRRRKQPKGFAWAAEVRPRSGDGGAVETGGALTALGEGALAVAGAAGAATGGLVAAGAAAAVVGTAWDMEGGVNAASHLLGWAPRRAAARTATPRGPPEPTDVQTLNGMQESGPSTTSSRSNSAAGLPDRHGFRERAAGSASATDSSSPHPAPGPGPAAAHALRHQPGPHPGELRQRPHQPSVPKRPGALWAPRARHAPSRSRPSTPFVRRANLKLPNV